MQYNLLYSLSKSKKCVNTVNKLNVELFIKKKIVCIMYRVLCLAMIYNMEIFR